MAMTRRGFLSGVTAVAASSCLANVPTNGAIDPNKIVFLADPHISGKWAVHHQKRFLAQYVAEICAMNPRPANVIVLGDLANGCGFVEDYRDFAPIVEPLAAAGIRLTLGMGNHDVRENFLKVYPKYAETTKVAGRIVSEVNTPHADFILLDTLWEGTQSGNNHVDGQLDADQRKWLETRLAAATKPVFVGAHHYMSENGVGLRKLLVQSPFVHGYIYGHDHEWRVSYEHDGSYGNRQTLRTVCVPSAGHWGDIGYATLDIAADHAVMTVRQTDYFFNYDCPASLRQKGWDAVVAENNGRSMTFFFDKPRSPQPTRPWNGKR